MGLQKPLGTNQPFHSFALNLNIDAAALAVFPVLAAVALKAIWMPMLLPGGKTVLHSFCPANAYGHHALQLFPFRLRYTGIDTVDQMLCGLVTTFQLVMADADAYKFANYFLTGFLPICIIMGVEALRPGVGALISLPNLFFFIAQFASLGATIPIYWAFYIASGNLKKRRAVALSRIPRSQVVAFIFAFIVGSVLPVEAMFHLSDPYVTAMWQFYPIFVAISQYFHSKAVPPSTEFNPGFPYIRFLYIGSFILSSSAHIAVVLPNITGLSWPSAFDLPTLNPTSISTSTTFLIHNLLKWDFAFAAGSFALGSLWFARSFKELIGFVLWYAVATPVVGIGSAVMGVFIYDDAVL